MEIGPLGCIIEEEYTLATDEFLSQATGESVFFGNSLTEYNGHWRRLKSRGVTGVFLWEHYELYRPLRPHFQREGTCVARGFHRAVEMSYYSALSRGTQFGLPLEVAWEPSYPGSRNYIGGGKLRGAGSVGSWAAEWFSGTRGFGGFCLRGRYGSFDISRDNEQAAVEFGKPGRKLPQELLDACKKHTCVVKRVRNNDEIADAIASEHGVARCWSTLFGNRDSKGFSAPASNGAHCQAVIGVFVDENGEDGFVELQSWGDNNPRGPQELVFAGGKIQLPPGCYGVRGKHYRQAQQERWWEAHALGVRRGQEFRRGT